MTMHIIQYYKVCTDTAFFLFKVGYINKYSNYIIVLLFKKNTYYSVKDITVFLMIV
jgi:hypothetical protein